MEVDIGDMDMMCKIMRKVIHLIISYLEIYVKFVNNDPLEEEEKKDHKV